MSAIASFIQIPKTGLDGLRQHAGQSSLHDFLRQRGREVADYQWSGYVLAILLPYLQEEHQIDLMRSEHDELSALLSERQQATYTHRQAYQDRLDPQLFSVERLRDYNNEFNATDDPDAGEPMVDGIRALRQSLSALDESSVIVFSIG